jgi:hypothetical protein
MYSSHTLIKVLSLRVTPLIKVLSLRVTPLIKVLSLRVAPLFRPDFRCTDIVKYYSIVPLKRD